MSRRYSLAVLRIRIRDPVIFDPWIRDGKNADPGLFSLMRIGIRAPEPWIRDGKIQIRDKHPNPQLCSLVRIVVLEGSVTPPSLSFVVNVKVMWRKMFFNV
jgi:hypothetical protein